MRTWLFVLLVSVLVAGFASEASAQNFGEAFRKVSPSVVVIRAKGRDVEAGGQSSFSETVSAKVVASEPAADLSLLQLERVPPGAKSSPLANSDTIQVGDPVIIVGAPYGLSHSLSAGLISARWPP